MPASTTSYIDPANETETMLCALALVLYFFGVVAGVEKKWRKVLNVWLVLLEQRYALTGTHNCTVYQALVSHVPLLIVLCIVRVVIA